MNGFDNKKCPFCGCDEITKTNYKLRDSEDLFVIRCKNCTTNFLSSFNHIDNDFYAQGRMHTPSLTAQKWLKTSKKDDSRRFNFLKDKIKDKNILDFGCGAGGFLMLAKKYAKKVVGIEKDEGLKKFITKNNIAVFDNINDINEKFDTITMFHVLEHLKNPEKTIKDISKHLKPSGEMIIEIPNEDDILISLYKCKKFINYTHWSCHLYYYNEKSLRKLIYNSNCKINNIKYTQRYGLANHLYWLIKGERGGHKFWHVPKFIDLIYTLILKTIKKTDTLIVSISPR